MTDEGKKTVVLHIGRHKTGTSSIQQTFAANPGILRRQGLLYPASLPVNQSGFFIDAFSPDPWRHPNNRRFNLSREALQQRVATQFRDFRAEVADFSGDRIVLCAEDACTLGFESVARIRKTFDDILMPDYRVVLYTRHPVSYASSAIQQNVKGNGLTIEDAKRIHLAGGGKRYSEIVDAYARVFGHDAVTLRSFEAAVKEKTNVVNDFSDVLGMDATGLEMRFANESIAAEIVHFISWLYVGPRVSEGRPTWNRETRVPVSGPDRARLHAVKGAKAELLDQDEIDEVWRSVSGDMAFLRETYGISYSKPEKSPGSPAKIFQPDFMGRISGILPRLAEPLQAELKRFLAMQRGDTQ